MIPLGATPKQTRMSLDDGTTQVMVIDLPREGQPTPVQKPLEPAVSRPVALPEPDRADPTPDAPAAVEPEPEIAPLHETGGGNGPADVVLGLNDAGSPIVWKPRVSGAPHAFILGIPGQGKSVTTERILIELAKTGTPALVLDFHRTYVDPAGEYARIAQPATLDASRGCRSRPSTSRPGTAGWRFRCTPRASRRSSIMSFRWGHPTRRRLHRDPRSLPAARIRPARRKRRSPAHSHVSGSSARAGTQIERRGRQKRDRADQIAV